MVALFSMQIVWILCPRRFFLFYIYWAQSIIWWTVVVPVAFCSFVSNSNNRFAVHITQIDTERQIEMAKARWKNKPMHIDWMGNRSECWEFCRFWKTHYRKSACKSKIRISRNKRWFQLKKKKCFILIRLRILPIYKMYQFQQHKKI